MSQSMRCEVDPVKELRLRRWARENYVPAASRKDSWHFVVLDEMETRDAELALRIHGRPIASRFVPLAPTNLVVLHPAHTYPEEPRWRGQANLLDRVEGL